MIGVANAGFARTFVPIVPSRVLRFHLADQPFVPTKSVRGLQPSNRRRA